MTRSSERHVLRLERSIPAPSRAVYKALTDPQELAKWWGPRGFTATSVEFNPQVGEGYRIAMQPPDGDLFHLTGEFREVEPATRLAYTFRWHPPHPYDRETVVTLSLDDRGDKTKVRLTQGEFATEERCALHEAGWTESLDRLEQQLREQTLGMAPPP
ncbi:MAG: SRPBCC family protein [Verrucomicrobiota bacterium]